MSRIVHRSDDTTAVLATDVAVADSFLSRARGLMFRRSFPEDAALVFPFGAAAVRTLHMVCVPFDVDAVWLHDGRVEHVARLSAWTGFGRARADTVIEFPAGVASDVTVGDELRIEPE